MLLERRCACFIIDYNSTLFDEFLLLTCLLAISRYGRRFYVGNQRCYPFQLGPTRCQKTRGNESQIVLFQWILRLIYNIAVDIEL